MSAPVRAVLGLALVAAPLAAQAPGLPVPGGGFRRGVELAATVGWAGAESQTGEATTWGGTLAYGWSRIGIAATLGVLDGDQSSATLGLLLAARLLGDGVSSPFELGAFGGFGTMTAWGCPLVFEAASSASAPCDGGDRWRIPLGAALSAAITTPYVSIRPWLAPRAEILEVGNQGAMAKFAGSAGVDFRFAGGLGVRALWEKVTDQDQTLGVGLSYRF